MFHDSVNVGRGSLLLQANLLLTEALLTRDLPILAIGIRNGQSALHDEGCVASAHCGVLGGGAPHGFVADFWKR